MQVYRITLAKWADSLYASGNAARWNSKGQLVIYTASSRALACLENVVHRSGEGLQQVFKVMLIDVPESLGILEISPEELPLGWNKSTMDGYEICQHIGNEWLNQNQFPLLKVPSAIIPKEYNFLINVRHPDFRHITLLGQENFEFDNRIK